MKEQKDLTGPQLFLRFAYPCAWENHDGGKLDDRHFNRLEKLIYEEEDFEPNLGLLKFCFPKAVAGYERFVGMIGHGNWDPKTVENYWLYHHRHEEAPVEVDVMVASVLRIERDNFVIVSIVQGGTTMNVPHRNVYNLKLSPGDIVFTHHGVIVFKQ